MNIPERPSRSEDIRALERRVANLEAAPNAYAPKITTATTTANGAAETAGAAVETATTATNTATAAQEAASTATETATTASNTATAAQQAASEAAGTAGTALDTANGAKDLATGANQTSQTALDSANDAIAAAGTAQDDATTALNTANQVASDLGPVSDTANQALDQSDTALQKIGSIGTNYYGTGGPPAVHTGPVGDTYYQYTTSGSMRLIVARWQWDGAAWVQTALSSASIDKIDAGAISTGILSTNLITIRTDPSGGAYLQMNSLGIEQINDQGGIDSFWYPNDFYMLNGTIEGSTIIGSTIKTSGSAQRIEMDDDELVFYNGNVQQSTIRTGLTNDGNPGLLVTTTGPITLSSDQSLWINSDQLFLELGQGSLTGGGIGNHDVVLSVSDSTGNMEFGLHLQDSTVAGQHGYLSAPGTAQTVEALRWDADGVVLPLSLYFDTAKSMRIQNNNNALWFENTPGSGGALQLGTGSGRFQIGGQDKLVWGPNGVYAYQNLYFRTAGGSQTNTYLNTDGSGNLVFNGNYFKSPEVWITGAPTSSGITANAYITTTAGLVGRVYRATSLDKYKLDQQELKADYRILDVPVITWIDKTFSEEFPGYKRRSVGSVAERVRDFSRNRNGAFDPLVMKDPVSGKLEGVAYDRYGVYLLPVVKDIHRRLEELERKVKAR